MSTTESQIESEIQARGLNAPRLRPQDIDTLVVHEEYAVMGGAIPVTTICVLTLRNGFTVVGHSAPVSPENFDADLGKRIARERARAQIWPLAGYALREKLAEAASADR